MLLKNDIEGINNLDDAIQNYYKNTGGRVVRQFSTSENIEWGWTYLHYLVDRNRIFRYGIGQDRTTWVGGIELAIGPHYFGVADFWSYENAQRFKIEASTDAAVFNLRLLDEFWGCRGKP